MNEQELRDGLRSAMAVATPPPRSVNAAAVIRGARRARARQRTIWAGAGTGLLVAAVLVGAGLPLGSPGQPLDFGAPGVAPSPGASKPGPWPTGPDGQPQEDRTARAGERYEQGVKLLDRLVAAVPLGYTVPDRAGNGRDIAPSRHHQAQFEDRVGGTELWSYQASIEVARGQGTGRILAEVHTAGNQLPSEPCALSQRLWGMRGECQLVSVGAAQVGVVAWPTGGDPLFDQWAGFRHPDGVVVFVAQARSVFPVVERQQPLTTLPFTVQQLAALATSENLHLN
jgi:hypothetical protein